MARLDWYIRSNLKMRHFQWLVALDDMRSMSRAALLLGMTEAQLQKSLSGLEQSLQASLFEDTARGLEPTEMGICLIRHGRRVLNLMLNAQEELRDMDEGRVARVKLGVMPAATARLLPAFIAKLETESVPVAVSVQEGTQDTLLQALRNGSIDLAISIMPPRGAAEQMHMEFMYEEEMVLAVRQGHPLLDGRPLDWDVLAAYPLVLSPQGTWFRQRIERLIKDYQLSMHRMHMDSTSNMSNVGVLQATDSIGFLARDVAESFAELGVLSVLPLSLPDADIPVGLIWMRERHMAMELKLVHMSRRASGKALPPRPRPASLHAVSSPFPPPPVQPRSFW
ncbi:MAG: LysR family transcriptional regulator, partial [Limnohabitans sp.]